MNFKERSLYHQIHPIKLLTDVSITPIALWCVGHRRIGMALTIGFLPPILVSAVMMKWPPASLERIRRSKAGKYLRNDMAPAVEAVRLLTLIPTGYGAWKPEFWPIWVGLIVLILAWANGFLHPREHTGSFL